MDDTLARLKRALQATPEDPAAADALEAALLRAGRLDEAYLLRWRRGEPSPVAEAVAAAQRATLDALAADPHLAEQFCEGCGADRCGVGPPVELAVGPAPDALRWFLPSAAELRGANLPIVGARLGGLAEHARRVARLRTIVHLRGSLESLQRFRSIETFSQATWREGPDRRQLRAGTLASLRALDLRQPTSDLELDALLAGCSASLERLSVNASQLTDAGLGPLGSAPRLRSVELRGAGRLEGPGLAALVDGGAPIEHLALLGAEHLGPAGVDAVGELEGLASLELGALQLDLDGALTLSELPGLRRLVLRAAALPTEELDGFPALRELELVDCRGADGLLARAPAWSTLETLTLTARSVAPELVAGLAHAPRLERLALHAALDDGGLEALCRSPSLLDLTFSASDALTPRGRLALARSHLRRLELSCAAITDDVLDALACATELRELRLTHSWPRSIDARVVAGLARLPRLEALDLASGAAPGALGLLAGAPRLRTLRTSVGLDQVALAGLAASPTLERLETFGGSAAWHDELRAALPGVTVREV